MADLKTIPGLEDRLKTTRWRLSLLRRVEALAPALIAAFMYLALVLSGLMQRLGGAFEAGVSLAFLALIAGLAIYGLRRYRAPSADDVAATLDRGATSRPLAFLRDRSLSGTGPAFALWQAERARAIQDAGALPRASLGADWRRVDPAFLRFVLPLILAVLLLMAGPAALKRLGAALFPDVGALFGADRLVTEAWIRPPDYTGVAPVFLNPARQTPAVPQGSEMTLRVTANGAPKVRLIPQERGEAKRTIEMVRGPDGVFEARLPLETSQRVEINWWGARGAYVLDVTPDTPPVARFAEMPSLGARDSLTFGWVVSDDYGVDDLSLRLIHTAATGNISTDEVPVTMEALSPREANDTATLDLTRHKWAGLTVDMQLVATDARGQTGVSDVTSYRIPDKLFLQPLAQATQEIRLTALRTEDDYAEPSVFAASPPVDIVLPDGTRGPALIDEAAANRLERAPDGIRRAALMLDTLTYKPGDYFEDLAVYLGLRSALGILNGARSLEETASVEPLLWSVALKAEYGDVADAARALEAARRALERALREGAGEEEIKRLMQAFREAAENYIAARMAEAIRNGSDEGAVGDELSSMMGGNDLEEMLSALEDLTETGASDAARKLLADVSKLLEELQFQAGGGGESREGAGEQAQNQTGPPEEEALKGALERLSELLAEQRSLNDDVMAENRERENADRPSGERPGGLPQPGARQPVPPQGQDGQPGRESGEPGTMGEGEPQPDRNGPGGGSEDLAGRQSEIGDRIQEFAEGLEREGGPGGGVTADELAAARQALERATEALRRGDEGSARWNQDRAVRELRDATGELARSLDELREARLGEQGQGEVRDPLGRQVGGSGSQNDGSEVAVPDEIERQRAREILDGLRERLPKASDETEEEYLKRLLDRFGS